MPSRIAEHELHTQTSRRGALFGILGLLSTFVGCTSHRSRPRALTTGVAAPANSLADDLLRDLNRLSQRTYSEEGIPVFLVCENVIGNPDGTSRFLPQPSDQALVSGFHENAPLLPLIRSAPAADDVAKLIEVIADRNFGPAHLQQAP